MTSTFDPVNQRVDGRTNMARPRLKALSDDFFGLQELRRRWELTEANPVFLKERGQGTDASWMGLDIRTLVSGEESAGRFNVNDIVLAPGAGLPPHYLVDGYVYVIVGKGQLTLQVGNVTEEVSDNDFAFVPPCTRLAFRNRSSQPAELILIYSPAGAERAFSEAHEYWTKTRDDSEPNYVQILERYGFHFDDKVLENDGKTNAPIDFLDFEFAKLGDMPRVREAFANRPALPRIVKTPAEDVEAGASGGKVFRKAVLTGDDSGGQAMVHMLASRPEWSVPPHHQIAEEEFFFVRWGELEVACGSQNALVRRGAFAFAPRFGTHAFKVVSVSELTLFTSLNSPAGHERALAEIRRLESAKAPAEEKHAMVTAGDWVMH